MIKFNIGIDLGGTKIESVVLDLDSKILFRQRIPTESKKGSEHVLNQIQDIYSQALSGIQGKEHTLGIGTPGSLSKSTGLLRNSTISCQNGLPIHSLIEKKLSHSLSIENDANCFALAESFMGAGKKYDLVFGVIMGTGCGGGFIHNGELRTGPQRLAGEWGHSVVNPNGPQCFCGKKGCVSTFISGSGLEEMIYENLKIKVSAEKFLSQLIYSSKEEAILNKFYEYYGLSLANIINTIDPDVIILGGGLSNHQPLYTKGLKMVYKNIFCDEPNTPILKNALGDSAGVIGAAIIGKIKAGKNG
jgi:fructokinase|tara:strand:+ start:303 stop:1211 length:909 start_codon:yes stop_codon:yes gene_type:complete